MLHCSCSAKKGIFNNKYDYVVYNEDRYIQANVIENPNAINKDAKHQIVINNFNNDTLYLFSTVIMNGNMFYSNKNISSKRNKLLINSYYDNFITDAVHSGIRTYTFIKVLPGDSLVINIESAKISALLKPTLYIGNFRYYYFLKNGNSFDELVNISRNKIKHAQVPFYLK